MKTLALRGRDMMLVSLGAISMSSSMVLAIDKNMTPCICVVKESRSSVTFDD